MKWFWFIDYLNQRQHYVHFNDASSPLLPAISGIPQGSVLGPLLFLIYVNDIPLIQWHSTHQYTCLLTTLSSPKLSHSTMTPLNYNLISTVLQNCATSGDRVSLNPQKCACLRFTLNPSSPTPSYTINGIHIYKYSSGPTRSWYYSQPQSVLESTLLKHLLKSMLYSTFYLQSHLHHLPHSTQANFIHISCKISAIYCSQLYQPHYIKDVYNIVRIESVQHRSTKFILSYPPINYKNRLIQLKILPLMHWY